jgi:hypothetical protein
LDQPGSRAVSFLSGSADLRKRNPPAGRVVSLDVAVRRAAREVVMGAIPAAVFMFLSVGAVALFSFVAVASWADARRKEREAYYKSETFKKIAETQGANAVLDLLREEQKQTVLRRREGLRLGGLINTAAGVGLMVFLAAIERSEPVYLVGLIPLLIGVVLVAYGFFLFPHE